MNLKYRHYVLGLLTLVYIINFLDRQVVIILIEPIKDDLGLTDSQLGFLSGTIFAIFYTILGVPIARYADQTVRKNIVAGSLAIWSFMTLISGFATGFLHLILTRIGLGVGQAGCTPPIHSLLADYFPIESRTNAISIYSMGPPLGILVAFVLGGWVAEVWNWRTAFIVAGIPGLVLSVLVFFTVKEPAREEAASSQNTQASSSLVEVLKYLWSLPAWRHLMFASALVGLALYGTIGTWMPSILKRTFDMDMQNIGLVLGLNAGVTGAIGLLAGGFLTTQLMKRNPRWLLLTPAITLCVAVFFYVGLLATEDYTTMITLMIIFSLISGSIGGPQFSAAQTLAPASMRAVSSSILLAAVNLIGIGFGPLIVGAISDAFAPQFGDASLRMALLCTAPLFFWAAFHFYLASNWVADNIARVAEVA